MKKVGVLSLLGVVFSIMLVGCGKSSPKYVEVSNSKGTEVYNFNQAGVDDSEADPRVIYNDTLYNLAFSCKDLEASLRDTYNQTSNIEDLRSSIDNMISKCSDVLKSIELVGDLDGDSSFKDGVKTVIEKEIAYYTKVIDILPFLPYIDNGELTEGDSEIYEGIRAEIEALDKELTRSDENLVKIQEDFAERHGFRLDGVEYADEEDDVQVGYNEDNDVRIGDEDGKLTPTQIVPDSLEE